VAEVAEGSETPSGPRRRPRRGHHHTVDGDPRIYASLPPAAERPPDDSVDRSVPASDERTSTGEAGSGPDPEKTPGMEAGSANEGATARFQPVFPKVEELGVEWDDETASDNTRPPSPRSSPAAQPQPGLVTFNPVATAQTAQPAQPAQPVRPAPPAPPVQANPATPPSPPVAASYTPTRPPPVPRPFVPTTECPNCNKQFTLNLRFQYTECPWCGFAVARPE